ncbi:MAG: methylmalonyl Co-A mutase-associated GTPase MeaB [Peptostreptococcaceae bacterium]|nr:methylmalonyl Co-A mutase-associated GTPase MeaB [Peptostreptococcaceae bacterium]
MEQLIERLIQGDKVACARLISIVENGRDPDYDVLKKVYRKTQGAYIVGVTGPPGAGKSTLTDKLVKELRKKDMKIGIIAIDPSSPFSKGAILGDRIRMSDLYLDPMVFIRSMGSRGQLGGISKATQGAIKVLDAYGCDFIFVETVGVGQSEVEIVKTADTTLMIMVPGLGDDIQAIKAGVMEVGDVFVINKADKDGAKKTFREIDMMLDFKKDWDFRPPISMTVGETGEGVEVVVENILTHKKYLEETGNLAIKQLNRNKTEIREIVYEHVEEKIATLTSQGKIEEMLLEMASKESDPYSVAQEIIKNI